MKIILRQDFEPLGKSGSIREVKDGYARNFLIPKGIVYPATQKFQKMLADEERLSQKRNQYKQSGAQELADLLAKTSVVAKSKAGEEGRLFGSVTSQDIADLLSEQNIEVDKRKIVLDEPIRILGTYQVRIRLHTDVEALLQVSVVKEE
ncbi:MAG: 50S ribosomal protein L9 [bacterium]